MLCPICGSDFDTKISTAMPFCSDRCRKIDLHRWFGEEYSFPTDRIPEEDELEASESADPNHSWTEPGRN